MRIGRLAVAWMFGLVMAGVACGQPATQPAHPGTLYMVGYSHLDTQWRWTYPTVIAHYIRNTMEDNFPLFEKYPHYIFNWTGANRYRLMKEYYPADFEKVKQFVAAGRWWPAGSAWEESLANEPSSEALVRQVLYGNEFFRKELGKASNEFMLPDTFGFPASLPTILAHCGVKGFSTQKLGWGSAVGIPFNIGKWEGPDGRSIIAVMDAGNYTASVKGDPSVMPSWTNRVEKNGKRDGVYIDYRYYGTGDRGGSPGETSVRNVEQAVTENGPIKVISATAAQMFDELTPQQISAMPTYKGDLLLTQHSAGTPTSQSFQKWLNRKNELLADEAERASVAADLLGGVPYPIQTITDGWHLLLAGQFHDILAGTCVPKAIEYAWNDGMLSRNELAGVRDHAVAGVSRAMDTQGDGVSLVIYNPLSIERQDVVEADVTFAGPVPKAIEAIGPDGEPSAAQVLSSEGNQARVAILARVPSIGFAVYDVREAKQAPGSSLKVSDRALENDRYQVQLNDNGDVAQIVDKAANKPLLASPLRLAFLHDTPQQYPAWNVDYGDRTAPPYAYVEGSPEIRVVENGPARVALQVKRTAQGSTIVQTIRLSAGEAGNRVEFDTHIDWHTPASDLKAVFPLTVSNPMATYNWETGTVQRGNNDPKKYEVPAHQWFDLTDQSGKYGVSVLEDCKYASDKPDDNTLRLTLMRTPGVHKDYTDQATQDFGRHHVLYALEGHSGDWRDGQTPWEGMRVNQPLTAFVVEKHEGPAGKSVSLLSVNTRQVAVRALKRSEDGNRWIIRLQELTGRSAKGVVLSGLPIADATFDEVDGQERKIGDVRGPIDLDGYGLRAYSPVTAVAVQAHVTPPQAHPIALPFDVKVTTPSADVQPTFQPSGIKVGFDADGRTLPAEMFPGKIECEGVPFDMGPNAGVAANAVECQGQKIELPAGFGRLFLIAAASNGDAKVNFQVGERPVEINVQDWGGYIGLTDNRVWKGSEYPEADYAWHNRFAGLTPGFVRPDPVAWYSSHRHAADRSNEIYEYCYLFKYEIPLPKGATTLTLPDEPRVKILAATAVQGEDAVIAGPVVNWPWEGIALTNPTTQP